jgi:hypothetical protein
MIPFKFKWNLGQLPLQELRPNKANNAKPNNTFFMAQDFNKVQTISDFISTFDLQTFLSENGQLSPETFLLQCKDNTKEQNWYLAEQLKLYPKAKYKLPSFTNALCWFTGKSYEQCSSEASAKLKSNLFNGGKLLDLSGGLGVDDVYFSESFKEVISLDPDEKLNILTEANFRKLQKFNIKRISETAESFLETNNLRFSLIYLDADRRTSNQKSKLLETGSPDFFSLEEKLYEFTDDILLKLSPLIDIDYCLENLRFIKKVIVVSVDFEVKEVLCHLSKNHQNEVTISNYFLDRIGGIEGKIASNNLERKSKFEFTKPNDSKYFFEASPGLIKSGLDKIYAFQKNLYPINQNGFYFLSENDHSYDTGFGRYFEIISKSQFSKSQFKDYLKKNSINQANISARDFGMSVDEIKKMFQIKDGSEDYFFFGRDADKTKWFFHTRKKYVSINPDK